MSVSTISRSSRVIPLRKSYKFRNVRSSAVPGKPLILVEDSSDIAELPKSNIGLFLTFESINLQHQYVTYKKESIQSTSSFRLSLFIHISLSVFCGILNIFYSNNPIIHVICAMLLSLYLGSYVLIVHNGDLNDKFFVRPLLAFKYGATRAEFISLVASVAHLIWCTIFLLSVYSIKEADDAKSIVSHIVELSFICCLLGPLVHQSFLCSSREHIIFTIITSALAMFAGIFIDNPVRCIVYLIAVIVAGTCSFESEKAVMRTFNRYIQHEYSILKKEKSKREQRILMAKSRALASTIQALGHDLKTPLQMLNMSVMNAVHDVNEIESLAKSASDSGLINLSSGVSEGLNSISFSYGMITSSINRVIDAFHVTNNLELQPREESADLHELLLSAVSSIQISKQSVHIQITVDASASEKSHHIVTDGHWFFDNIQCLLNNGVKFTRAGMVELSLRIEKRKDEPERFMLVFEVTDSGIGIENEEELFNMSRDNQEMHGGLGLGLFCLRMRCKALGGDCGGSNRSDGIQGAKIWFSIPYNIDVNFLSSKVDQSDSRSQWDVLCSLFDAAGRRHRGVTESFSSESAHSLSILLVGIAFGDLKSNAGSLTTSHEIILAQDGLQALDLMKSRLFDIVLIDTETQTSYEVVRALREFEVSGAPLRMQLMKESVSYDEKAMEEIRCAQSTAKRILGENSNIIEVVSRQLIVGTSSLSYDSAVNSDWKAAGIDHFVSPKMVKTAQDLVIICRRFHGTIEDMTQSLDIVSKPSVNIITLSSMSVESCSAKKKQENSSISVLVVDDAPTVLKVVSKELDKAGYQVFTAENGLVALELLLSKAFNILLTDIQMPVKDGIECVLEFREKEASGLSPKIAGQSKLVIVGMSANSSLDLKDEAIDAGMNAFTNKPFKAADLFRTFDHWLEEYHVEERCFTDRTKSDRAPVDGFPVMSGGGYENV